MSNDDGRCIICQRNREQGQSQFCLDCSLFVRRVQAGVFEGMMMFENMKRQREIQAIVSQYATKVPVKEQEEEKK